MKTLFAALSLVFISSTAALARGVDAPEGLNLPASSAIVDSCDPGVLLSPRDRRGLLSRLGASSHGRQLLNDFAGHYGSLENLVIQWDTVSYSQVISHKDLQGRIPAFAHASRGLGGAVCVHLTRRLPNIEHLADLAHEITHVTRLEPKVLHGELADVDEFVRARLGGRGGEADAFSVECAVKRELLGHWDALCSPYVDEDEERFDTSQVVRDFYNGKLSASLTGETYPVMLSRQYQAMLARKATAQVQSATRRPASLQTDK